LFFFRRAEALLELLELLLRLLSSLQIFPRLHLVKSA
jgi:hypothetical protein